MIIFASPTNTTTRKLVILDVSCTFIQVLYIYLCIFTLSQLFIRNTYTPAYWWSYPVIHHDPTAYIYIYIGAALCCWWCWWKVIGEWTDGHSDNHCFTTVLRSFRVNNMSSGDHVRFHFLSPRAGTSEQPWTDDDLFSSGFVLRQQMVKVSRAWIYGPACPVSIVQADGDGVMAWRMFSS